MVHAADSCITQHLDSSELFKFRWAKNVINAPIVDCGIAGPASQITKVAQDVTVRFTVMFQVVRIKICHVGSFKFKVEITCDENLGRLHSTLCPIYQRFRVAPSASSIERISVDTQQQNVRRVLAQSE